MIVYDTGKIPDHPQVQIEPVPERFGRWFLEVAYTDPSEPGWVHAHERGRTGYGWRRMVGKAHKIGDRLYAELTQAR